MGTIATLVTIWYTVQPWPMLGWVTPNQHDADFVAAVEELKEFRDEWKCDEYEEELEELHRELADGTQSLERRLEIEREIEKIKDAMERRDCARFDDFG